jgi:DNA-binding transcriptional MerR regulator
MKTAGGTLWTIEQLRDAVAAALEEGYTGPPNGRIRDVPEERTIRYYTTLGLIDRAAEMRGRTALYGRRHLLQLVAIKKLQAKGQTLAEVQRALTGQSDAALARLAAIKAVQAPAAAKPASSVGREFWKEIPAQPGSEMEVVAAESRERAAGQGDHPQTLQGVLLADDVTLLVASARPLESEDLQALRSAARPLIELLVELNILSPPREERGIR